MRSTLFVGMVVALLLLTTTLAQDPQEPHYVNGEHNEGIIIVFHAYHLIIAALSWL